MKTYGGLSSGAGVTTSKLEVGDSLWLLRLWLGPLKTKMTYSIEVFGCTIHADLCQFHV